MNISFRYFTSVVCRLHTIGCVMWFAGPNELLLLCGSFENHVQMILDITREWKWRATKGSCCGLTASMKACKFFTLATMNYSKTWCITNMSHFLSFADGAIIGFAAMNRSSVSRGISGMAHVPVQRFCFEDHLFDDNRGLFDRTLRVAN